MQVKELCRNYIEISKDALDHNYQLFRGMINKDCKLMAVVKSNAYGHDLVQYSRRLEMLGADYLGVDNITEAIALRKNDIKLPILILGYTLPARIIDVVNSGSEMTVSNMEQLQEIENRKFDKKVRVHLKIDTGMHRQGFQEDEIDGLIEKLKTCKNIEIIGIYTHFADSKNPTFPANTRKQIATFNPICDKFKSAGYQFIKHAAATAGALAYPESHFDMVRVGIGLMGLWPSVEVGAAFEDKVKLIPILTWKSILSEVKSVKCDERVGYDCTERMNKDSRLAIVPVGYWHGFKRSLSGIGRVGIHGKLARVVGRISMDMVVVDVTDIPEAKSGDTVILISGDQELSAYQMAKLVDGSWYEIVTNLNPQILREFV